MSKEFYSNGKLLLTGEYVILDGALGLALPTSYGQTLKLIQHEAPTIKWTSYALDGSIWFEAIFDTYDLSFKQSSDIHTAKTLQKILAEAKNQNPEFLKGDAGYVVETAMDFDRSWGLGSSSTLINNIAHWAEVDAYQLLWKAFSGSGYDIACAQNNSPILYQLKDQKPIVEIVDFNPVFRDRLYFIHLNKKQNSREGITRYHNQSFDKQHLVKSISNITRQLLNCTNLFEFEELLTRHEAVIAENLKLRTVKAEKFPDYFGAIKSLGAWGGDFIMATGNEDTANYFEKKGFATVIPFENMIL